MSIFYVILAILFFGMLIIVHELGHFAAAKAFGVRVEEFAVGMGPVLFSRERGETTYSLRAVPFGGFCAMAGEDEALDDVRAFTSQKPWKRAIILCAGSFMNFVTGLLIVLVLYSGAAAFRAPIITDFMEGCPYQGEDAFQKGDRIHSIDGKRIYQYADVTDFLSQGDGTHDIVVKRDGKKVRIDDMHLVPVEYPGESRKMYGFYFGYEVATPTVIIRNAWDTTMEFGRWVGMGLQELVRGNVGVEDMSGPVGIVGMMAETGESAETTSDALYSIFYLGAFIAVNLALMNMLPIPALDGGRVFLLLVTMLIEALTKKKLDPKYEGYIHAAGMVLLLALMAFVMFNDIIRIVMK